MKPKPSVAEENFDIYQRGFAMEKDEEGALKILTLISEILFFARFYILEFYPRIDLEF